MPLTQSEILRNHVMYQKSYTGNDELHPVRIANPVRKQPVLKGSPKNKVSLVPVKLKERKSKEGPPQRRIFKSLAEELDYRRQTRSERVRPWQEKAPKQCDKQTKVQLYYGKTLPTKYLDDTDLTIKPRKYVSNTKYGNIYEIREKNLRKKTESPTPRRWIWEDEYQFWLRESRERYLMEHGAKAKHHTVTASVSSESTPRSLSRTPRDGSFPILQEKPKDRPSADLYVSYNSHRLERTRRKTAATAIQRMFRGWYVRAFIAKLKKKALFDHGRTWTKFISEYRELVAKIQSRYGVMKPSYPIDIKQINTFMDKKKAYEAAFRKVSKDGKLHKDNLMEFFNRCDLWPTQRDVNRSFDTVFKGSRNTAEVVFLLDCSTSTGMVGFHSLIKFVRDVVISLDIAPDRIRVGVVPFNEDVFSSFGINAFNNKREVLDAITKIKIRHGLTRTDLALRLMREMFKNARPGVQKLGIVITDGKSTDPGRTEQEAKTVKETGVELFAIGIGNNIDEDELQHIASSLQHVHRAPDTGSLSSIKRQIEKRFCIDSPINAPIRPSSSSHVCRPIDQSEALDLVWTCYPPEACKLQHLQFSRWIRPVIENTEVWSLLDDDIIRATGMKACLRLVIQSKLERQGYIMMPSDVKDSVEKVTSETQAMQIMEKFIQDKLKGTIKLDS